MFDLINIFEVFLPQLLLYPNPTDPLNAEAAKLLIKDEKGFGLKVKEYVKKFAIVSEKNKNELDLDNNKSDDSELSNASFDSNLSDEE